MTRPQGRGSETPEAPPEPEAPAKPSMRGRWPRPSAEDRFWKRVAKEPGENGCWIWTGQARGDYGHGGMWFRGRQIYAHVFSYALHYQPEQLERDRIDLGLGNVVRHWCHKHGCVRPEHLILGTTADNVADRDAAGHTARGEDNAAALLNAEKVREIRRRAADGEARKDLADAFGISLATIHDVVSRRSWKHIEDAVLASSEGKGHVHGSSQEEGGY